ncbi:MAG: hypothetical protein ACYC6N_26055, partial [Pirellulaceae bacterium]
LSDSLLNPTRTEFACDPPSEFVSIKNMGSWQCPHQKADYTPLATYDERHTGLRITSHVG